MNRPELGDGAPYISWVELLPSCSLDELKRVFILKILERCEGNRVRTAKVLGLSSAHLHKILRKFRDAGHHVTASKYSGYGWANEKRRKKA